MRFIQKRSHAARVTKSTLAVHVWPDSCMGDREDGRRTWLYAGSALLLTTDSKTSTDVALLDFFSAALTRVLSADLGWTRASFLRRRGDLRGV